MNATAGRVQPTDAFYLPMFTPGHADMSAGGGFGVVLTVNARRGVCLVLMHNAAMGEIPTAMIHSLLLQPQS